MSEPKLISYLITTRNKLPFLKQALSTFIARKIPDEEILIADGASTDGTKEYLAQLKSAGKIDFFISEPDYGIAHANNKLILKAGGTFFKFITDDDVFDYSVIRKCATFLSEHPDIDCVNTEGGSLNDPSRTIGEEDPLQIVRAIDYAEQYKKWQKDHIPFTFCDLGLLFRRSSLPVMGMYDPASGLLDFEYSLRLTRGRANIAWYSGYSYVNISNPQSFSLVNRKKIKRQTDKYSEFYLNKKPDLLIVEKFKVLKNKISDRLRHGLFGSRPVNTTKLPGDFQSGWPALAEISMKWLTIKNDHDKPGFTWNTKAL